MRVLLRYVVACYSYCDVYIVEYNFYSFYFIGKTEFSSSGPKLVKSGSETFIETCTYRLTGIVYQAWMFIPYGTSQPHFIIHNGTVNITNYNQIGEYRCAGSYNGGIFISESIHLRLPGNVFLFLTQ